MAFTSNYSVSFASKCLVHDSEIQPNICRKRAVAVAQLVERSLPTLEVNGSNTVIDKIYIELLLSTVLKFEKTKIKGKRGQGRAHF